MYNFIFVAYYKFRLLFRKDLSDQSKDKSDAAWSSFFVTLIQFFQFLGIWTALIYMGRLPDNLVKLMPIVTGLFLILYLLNEFYFFNFKKAQALIEKDKLLSPDKRARNTFLAIVIIVLSITFFAVTINLNYKLHPHSETYDENK